MPTPTATIEQLFDLETAFLSALSSILTQSSLGIHVHQGTTEKHSPRLELTFDVGSVTEHYGIKPDGTPYFDTWRCTASVIIVTNRHKSGQNHGTLRGRVRAYLQDIATHFTPEVLPWHSIAWVAEKASRSSVNDHDEDETEIQFEVVFSILDTAWPQPSA